MSYTPVFIDSYDWLMVPNVYGMSQFSDGGFIVTKPYISSNKYLMKMSNYKKGERHAVACHFWLFMDTNHGFYSKKYYI